MDAARLLGLTRRARDLIVERHRHPDGEATCLHSAVDVLFMLEDAITEEQVEAAIADVMGEPV